MFIVIVMEITLGHTYRLHATANSVSIINKNTVYTRVCLGDRTKVNLDRGL